MTDTLQQYDTIEELDGALIQHGPANERVYLMKLGAADPAATLERIETLAQEKGYSKLFVKVPSSARQFFDDNGFRLEARIPGFYQGHEDGCFFGRYFDEARAVEGEPILTAQVLAAAREKAEDPLAEGLDPRFELFEATPDDAEEVAKVYRSVFETYPFPIHQPDYIRQTMADNIVYFGIRCEGRIIAMASSEMDEAGGNVEMTDFATLPEWRGHGLAVHLLRHMEQAMRERGIHTAYTIARAYSHGMNITFARMGYRFAGTLTNNTHICGRLESMNVWYRSLAA